MNFNFLTIVQGKLTLFHAGNTGENTVITSKKQLGELLKGEECCCSSNVDFPEDCTDDAAVIALCEEIRSL